ncbi:MAG TPA: pyridoxamine 5'-phosphate oxidase family protein [Micromonosporaceae bacterium]
MNAFETTELDVSGTGVAPEQRQLEELTPAQALGLLASVPFGRIVFTDRALPAIRPVNHLVDGGSIVIRTDLRAAVTRSTGPTGAVVAYEADEIDPIGRVGWSVVVTGFARLVTDPDEIDRYHRLLVPWIGDGKDSVIRIHPEIVNGYRLGEPPPAA